MPDSSLNGQPDHTVNHQVKHEEPSQSPLPNGNAQSDHNDGPPLKRRKLADESDRDSSRSRQPSPPWRKFDVEGPTTFSQDGKRRSARTNMVPLELQPNQGKRQTRTAYNKTKVDKKTANPNYQLSSRIKPQNIQVQKPIPTTDPPKRGPGRPRKSDTNVAKQDIAKDSTPKSARFKTQPTSPSSVRQNLEPARRRGRNVSSTSSEEDAESKRLMVEIERKKQLVEELQARKGESKSRRDAPAHPTRPLPILRKVTLRVNLPKPVIATPGNAPLAAKFSSFNEFLEKDDTEFRAGQDLLSRGQISREADARIHVNKARESGYTPRKEESHGLAERQDEPDKQYAHRDHLMAHLSFFRKLVLDEKRKHRRQAAELAHEARRFLEDKRKKTRVKSQEEIDREEAERLRNIYRSVVRDVGRLWTAVAAEVTAVRMQELEQQRQAELKGHLSRVLDRTDEMLMKPRHGSSLESEESGSNNGHDSSDDDMSESLASGQMSDSEQSEEEDDGQDEERDLDAGLTVDELKTKYSGLEDVSVPANDVDQGTEQESGGGDTSETDTELDSEFDTEGSDDEVEYDNEEEADADSNDDTRVTGGLLALFSRREIAEIKETTAESEETGVDDEEEVELNTPTRATPEASASQAMVDHIMHDAVDNLGSELVRNQMAEGGQEDSMNLDPTGDDPDSMHFTAASPPKVYRLPVEDPIKSPLTPTSQGAAQSMTDPADSHVQHNAGDRVSHLSTQPSPPTSVTKTPEAQPVSPMEEDQVELHHPLTPDEHVQQHKTPVPHLLRGTLREYQHEGLDWLADLYRNGRSGILADEMGLGKTIQSIALLAHLAVEHEIWGPHLIVVPTSVMLNWEMEFKKFLPGFKILTYYGNQEERKAKRKGWLTPDSFNVCITSYQLVVGDASSFKRRPWHYMILDEAHNIKNFRSERWQTLMTFNTRARLLLTGTPLQNNLTELWSLLFFLHYGQEPDGADDAFAGLKEWTEWFRKPVESIMEQNQKVLGKEDQEQVQKLHKVIRPFLLRRLKADVEKQMPLKYEHVEMCRLSKRQRQLYDGFMSRAQTRETLASGNYLSIINALMQLRKVCNHPDLFETRPINTSFAMPRSVAAEFGTKDLLLRRKLANEDAFQGINLDFLRLAPVSCEDMSMIEHIETTRTHAYHQLKMLRDSLVRQVDSEARSTGAEAKDVMWALKNIANRARVQDLDRLMYQEAYRHHGRPIYGTGLVKRLTIGTTYEKLSRYSGFKVMTRHWETEEPIAALDLVRSVETRSLQMEPLVQKYACITPIASTTDLTEVAFGTTLTTAVRHTWNRASDPFHEARVRLSIAFPDKRLLQYDCGKLQRLDKLLRQLQAGGHRALIFTQMTKVLDILEQFLNIYGYRYLRLDGATKIEQRQVLTERFNADPRISCFILSSRSGGLGINLTGADTVIFYDMDWNPAMDKQCTDRAHRIGQTRDVHIYRFVSEHTIESNILRKASQKQLLDDVVIQKGDFTTDYLNKLSYKDMFDNDDEDDVAGAAMDRVLGNENVNLGQAEDQEDIAAAQVAAKEVENADEEDFEDKPMATTRMDGTPGPYGAVNAAIAEAGDADGVKHIDDYLLKMQKWLLKDVKLELPRDKKQSKKRRDEHRIRRVR